MPSLIIPYPPPVPLSLELRDSIIATLLHSSSIQKLNNHLLADCQATGWVDAVRKRTLQLLRTEKCATYKEVMDVLMKEIWEGWDRDPRYTPPNKVLPSNRDHLIEAVSAAKRFESRDAVDFVDPAVLTFKRPWETDQEIDQDQSVRKKANHDGGDGIPPKHRPRSSDSEKVDVKLPDTVVLGGIELVKKALENIVETPDPDEF